MSAYDNIKKAFQDLIAPEIQSLRGDIRVINERLDAFETRMIERFDHLDDKFTTKIDSLRGEMHSQLQRVDNRIDGLDRVIQTAIDIRERIVALEARRPA